MEAERWDCPSRLPLRRLNRNPPRRMSRQPSWRKDDQADSNALFESALGSAETINWNDRKRRNLKWSLLRVQKRTLEIRNQRVLREMTKRKKEDQQKQLEEKIERKKQRLTEAEMHSSFWVKEEESVEDEEIMRQRH